MGTGKCAESFVKNSGRRRSREGKTWRQLDQEVAQFVTQSLHLVHEAAKRLVDPHELRLVRDRFRDSDGEAKAGRDRARPGARKSSPGGDDKTTS